MLSTSHLGLAIMVVAETTMMHRLTEVPVCLSEQVLFMALRKPTTAERKQLSRRKIRTIAIVDSFQKMAIV
jgi:hypothetical protein